MRGLNRLDFRGRIGHRPILPGVYILSLTRASSRAQVGEPLLVKVVSPRRTILLGDAQARRAACDAGGGLASRSRIEALAPGRAVFSRQTQPAPASATPKAKASGRKSAPPTPDRGNVLGANVDLPALPSLDSGSPWAFAGLVLLVGLPLLLMSVLVVRFLRGSWNP